MSEPLKAPFPYFGGKSKAAHAVWAAFGDGVKNYVEPFAGSAAMLLAAPEGKRIETINDFDGFVANFWRAVAHDHDAVAHHADWPVSEIDLEARHAWLVQRAGRLRWQLEDPDFYDAKIAGWWVWGACNWIGSGWCSGTGPWVHDGTRLVRKDGNAGRGINRKLPDGGTPRGEFIRAWMRELHQRLRDVRVTCGDWGRVVKDSITTRHGLTAVFLDPPYEKGDMDYGAGGMGLGIADAVREWCAANGNDPKLRIVLCGHAGEHDALLEHGWHLRTWKAGGGYARREEAIANAKSETLWCSPHCVHEAAGPVNDDLFAGVVNG